LVTIITINNLPGHRNSVQTLRTKQVKLATAEKIRCRCKRYEL